MIKNHERIANAYSNLGNVNLLSGNYKVALEYFLEAKNIYESNVNTFMVAALHNSIGTLYEDLNNLEKAFENYKLAYQGFMICNNLAGIGISQNNIGSAYLKANQPDSSLLYYDRAIQNEVLSDDQYSLYYSYEGKANVYFSLGDYSQALDYYEKSKIIAFNLNNKSQFANANLRLANVYIKLGQINKATDFATQALIDANAIKDIKLIQMSHEVYSALFETSGDYEKSLDHYKVAINIKLKLINESELHHIYNTEISQLSKDKEIQKLEIERQQLLLSQRKYSLVLILIISLSVIIIMLLAYYLYLNKIRNEQKVKMKDLIVKHIEDRSKNAFDAEVQERKRLGLELHDGVGPLISLAKLNITALIENPEMLMDKRNVIMNNILINVNEVLKELKQISHSMAPIVLIENGFAAAIREMVTIMNDTDKYKVSLDIFGLNGSLDSYVEHILFRALQEIVNNFIRHANSTELSIQIVQNKEDLTIMVEDNGVGFDEECLETSKGLGLRSTILRIKNLNGQFHIDSSKGKGTIISIILPTKQTVKL
jgi:signal transduction histidine kinase